MTALVPLGVADPPPPCADVTADALVNEAGFYVIGNEIWLEHNGAPGLQRGSCTRADGVVVGPDTFVTTYSASLPPPKEPAADAR